MIPYDYLVMYDDWLVLIVRAFSEEEAIDKAKQDYPINNKYVKASAKNLDHVLSNSDDVITILRRGYN